MTKISPAKKQISLHSKEMEILIDRYFGRMNAPDACARIKGLCGDEMEFYLVINDHKLEEVKYYTEGCEHTKACAAMTAQTAQGKTINQALGISAGSIMKKLKDLPEDHLHCCILAVTTLYRALADFLLSRC